MEIDADYMLQILQELKERREAEHVVDTSNMKPLDIKGQLRLVRDKCPELWQRVMGSYCPHSFGLCEEFNICSNYEEECENECKECWDKALEGDE